MTITAQGVTTLADTLREAGRDVTDLVGLHRTEGQATLRAATIPVDTGTLEASAAVVATPGGFDLIATAPYGVTVHAGNPFFARAINAREQALTAAVADHITDALSHVRGA